MDKWKKIAVLNFILCQLFWTGIFATSFKANSNSTSTAPGGSNAIKQVSSDATFDKSTLSNNNVQPGNGYLSFTQDLFNVSGGPGLNMNIGIDYTNFGVYNQVRQDNLSGPTGILGLGWRFALSQVYVDHNGTTDTLDDKWYYQDDMGTVYPMERGIGNDKSLYIKGLSNYKVSSIKRTESDGSGKRTISDLIIGWKIVKTDGTKLMFGDYLNANTEASKKYLGVTFSSAGVVGLFNASSVEFYDRWFLAKVYHYDGIKNFTYEYYNREASDFFTGESIGYNGSQIRTTSFLATKACYIKSITSYNGDRIEFNYKDKDPSEYMDPTPLMTEPDNSIDAIEKWYLSYVSLFLGGTGTGINKQYVFEYNNSSDWVNISKNGVATSQSCYNKRVLKRISIKGTYNQLIEPPIELTYVNDFDGTTHLAKPGFGSIKSIKNALGQVTEYTYSKLDNVYPIYQDNNTGDNGNLSDLRTATNSALPSDIDYRSQFISGAGFLVVNEKMASGNWRPRYFALIDSGYRPISISNIHGEIDRRSLIYSCNDRLIVMDYDAVNNIDTAKIYKFEHNQFTFEEKWSTGVGTQFLISGKLALRTGNESHIVGGVEKYEKKVQVFIYDPQNSLTPWTSSSNYSNIYDEYDPDVSTKYYISNNALIIKRGLSATYKLLENNSGKIIFSTAETQFQPGDIYIKNVYQIDLIGDKVAIKYGVERNPDLPDDEMWNYDIDHNEGAFTYVFFQYDGSTFRKIKALSSFKKDLSSAILGHRGKVYFSDKWIGVYADKSYLNDKLILFSWDGKQKYYVPFDANWNGFYSGNGFISYKKNAANYTFNYKFSSIGPDGLPSRDGQLEENSGETGLNYCSRLAITGSGLNILKKASPASTTWNLFSNLTGETPRVGCTRFIDMNGDGLLDLVFQNGNIDGNNWMVRYNRGGNIWSTSAVPITSATPLTALTQFLDMNGDGLLDLVYKAGNIDPDYGSNAGKENNGNDCNGWVVNYNPGEGNAWPAAVPIASTISLGETPRAKYSRFVDINGDGLLDLVFKKNSTIDIRYTNLNYDISDIFNWWVCYNTGGGMWSSNIYSIVSTTAVPLNALTQFIDINGDGLLDLVYKAGNIDPDYGSNAGKENHGDDCNGWVVNYNPGEGNAWPAADNITDETPRAKYSQFIDMNGDGLLDLVFQNGNIDGNNWMVRYNRGGNIWSTSAVPISSATPLTGLTQFIDMNGDGLPDLLFKNLNHEYQIKDLKIVGYSDMYWCVSYNPGEGNTWPSSSPLMGTDVIPFAFLTNFIDINGDGLTDMAYKDIGLTFGDDGGYSWNARINPATLTFQCFNNAIQQNNVTHNFSQELIDSIIHRQQGITKSQTTFKYYDPTPGDLSYHFLHFSWTYSPNDNPDIPDVFEWYSGTILRKSLGNCEYPMPVSNYFTLDHTTNIPRNIKSCAISNSGAYTITYSYGDDLCRVAASDRSPLVSDLENPSTIPIQNLDGQPYYTRTYDANNTLISWNKMTWDTADISKVPSICEWNEPRLKKTEQSTNNIKTISEMKYNPEGYQDTIKITAPDGSKTVMEIARAYKIIWEMADSNLLDPVELQFSFIDNNNDYARQAGERILGTSFTDWKEYNSFFRPLSENSAYYKDPVLQASGSYLTSKSYSWDETKHIPLSITISRNGINANLQKQSYFYDNTGLYVTAEASNTDRQLVLASGFNFDLEGWSATGGYNSDGKFRTAGSAQQLSYALENGYSLNNCIVEFDACSYRTPTDGIFTISSLNGTTLTGSESFQVPFTDDKIGKMIHFRKVTSLNGNNFKINVPKYSWIDNIMIYPDTANVTINNYNKSRRMLESQVHSGDVHGYTIYDIDSRPLGTLDKEGRMFQWSHTYFSRDFSNNSDYDSTKPNMVEQVGFTNGNYVPYWSFETVGDITDNNPLPFWGVNNSTLAIDTHYVVFGHHSLKVTPLNSPPSSGVICNFMPENYHPQYSGLLGDTVTLSFWVYAEDTGTFKYGLACTDEYITSLKSAGTWTRITKTFYNVVSRFSRCSNYTEHNMISVFVTSLTPITFYIDGVILEKGVNATQPVVTTQFINSMGQEMQAHSLILKGNSGFTSADSIRVTYNTYDDQNRLVQKSNPVCFPYIGSFSNYKDGKYAFRLFVENGSTTELTTRVTNVYGSSNNPYSKISYKTDGTNRTYRTSSPGTRRGTGDGDVNNEYTYRSATSFATGTTYSPVVASNDNGKYTWNTVSQIPKQGDKTFTHSLTDWRNKTVLSYSTVNSMDILTNGSNVLSMSKYEYDDAGNVITEYAPSNFASSNPNVCTNVLNGNGSVTSYTYDGANRMMKRTSSDLNQDSVIYRYDYLGRLRFTQDPKHRKSSSWIGYLYDSQGRLFKTLEVTQMNLSDFNNQDKLDNPKWPSKTDVAKYSVVSENKYDDLGRLSKAISYSTIIPEQGIETSYEYDENNQVVKLVQHVPGFSDKIHHYSYSPSGLVTQYEYMNNGNTDHFIRTMTYDNLGRLESVYTEGKGSNGSKLNEVNYQYNDPRGLVTQVQTCVFTQQSQYDIQGKLRMLDINNTQPIFSEELAYDTVGFRHASVSLTQLFNGNITGIRYTGINPNSPQKGEYFKYAYDSLSRLTHTTYMDESSIDTGRYSSNYKYKVDGNISSFGTKKLEDIGNNTKQIIPRSADYDYNTGTHQLKSISGNLRGLNELKEDVAFNYDENGNIIKDVKKRLEIEYDWRNMPIRFMLRNSSGKIVYVSQVLYDASGNRVAKYEFTRN